MLLKQQRREGSKIKFDKKYCSRFIAHPILNTHPTVFILNLCLLFDGILKIKNLICYIKNYKVLMIDLWLRYL